MADYVFLSADSSDEKTLMLSLMLMCARFTLQYSQHKHKLSLSVTHAFVTIVLAFVWAISFVRIRLLVFAFLWRTLLVSNYLRTYQIWPKPGADEWEHSTHIMRLCHDTFTD